MTITSYRPLSLSVQNLTGSVGATSSQIVLSRGVADPRSEYLSRQTEDAAPQSAVTSFESDIHHIMSLGGAAALSNVSDLSPVSEEVSSSSKDSIGYIVTPQTAVTNVADCLKGKEYSSIWQGGEVFRGRSLIRTYRNDNPLERAQSRLSKKSTTIEVNVRPIESRPRQRSTFLSRFAEDSTDPRASFEDNLLEPCPKDTVCLSVSDVMNQSNAIVDSGNHISSVEASELLRYRYRRKVSFDGSTDGSLIALKASRTTPLISSKNLVSTMSQEEFEPAQVLLLACAFNPPPASIRLPQEIIRQIYGYLAPADFNSARHSCRLWYISSLERSILKMMLNRGGWSNSIRREISPSQIQDSRVKVNDEWLMSKSIARECALGPDWTGNGFHSIEKNSEHQHWPARRTPFIPISTTDFTEAGVQYPGMKEGNSGITFTVSTCGRFLMAAHGCLVYIYELNQYEGANHSVERRKSGALRPVTSLICPRRVLACSMDTSSQRYAIAILMDGRMGLVCDLTSFSERDRPNETRMNQAEPFDTLSAAAVYRGGDFRSRVSIKSSRTHGAYQAPTGRPPQFTFPVIAAAGAVFESGSAGDFQRQAWQDMLQTDIPGYSIQRTQDSDGPHVRSYVSSQKTKGKNNHVSNMPIEKSMPTMYAPLCSADDPPRSVALCPQRRCVAFGCSSGIELHWVDALTGQDLNRWFPLTAPSDYLFFLPPRAGVDSAKKLRLISSAGRPDEQSVIAGKFCSASSRTKTGHSKSTPFWGTLSSQHSGPWVALGAGDGDGSRVPDKDSSDHYRAIPLSDGYHILFTDPSTNLLCLGTDAPIGGPTKLLRKVWFAGPSGSDGPLTYTGASDLRSGVRVVAAYGSGYEQSVWLFSVPEDVFTDSMVDSSGNSFPFVGNTLQLENGNREWISWRNQERAQDCQDAIQGNYINGQIPKKDKLWPVQIRGQEIGKCQGLAEVAIDSGPQMTIWAFSKDGSARAWHMDDGNHDSTVKQQIILRDGTVRENGESCGETIDSRLPLDESPVILRSGERNYDGTASVSTSGYFTADLNPKLSPSTTIDQDGATFMIEGDYSYESDKSFETINVVHNRYDTVYHNNGFAGRCYIDQVGLDGLRLLDEAAGISRLDIDIR